ncbi:MAG: peptide ABC transporter substrate-binding protein [Actinomycetota bacterium]
MRVHRRFVPLALWCVLAISLQACNQSSSNPIPKPVAGGTLRVTVRDLSTLDPARASGRGSELILEQIFDPLTRIDSSGNVVPAAASSWQTSADGKTWTFHLAYSKFDDGSLVSAYDFKFAFDRLTSKAIGSDAAFQLEPVSGFKAARIDGTAKELSGVTALNTNTLRIKLDYPFYELPAFLADPALGPVSQKLFNKNPSGFGDMPIGNGPFKLAAPRTSTEVKLVPFDSHSGAKPYLDAIDVTVNADPNAAWSSYLNGSEDVAEVPPASVATDRTHYGPEGFTPNWAGVYYGPNLRMQKFQNPTFRRALSLAIDRVAIATNVYGGTKTPASGIIPRGIPGFGSDRCDACLHDITQSEQLITQVFGAHPPSIRIDHLDASPSREVADAIAANLREVGLNVTMQAYDSASYLNLLQSGKQELAELGWLADVPSPDGFLAQQLLSGSPNNQVGFSDGAFDHAISQARSSADAAARLASYRDAEKRALDLMPLIPVVFFRNHIGIASHVHGLYVNGSGLFDATSVWIAP